MTASDGLGTAGLVVSVIGFAVTIWQLVRTANAAKATQLAIETTGRRMRINHLLVLLPQLRGIEGDLDAAMADDDRKLAIRTLVNYSHSANTVAALLEADAETGDADLIVRLRSSATLAGKAKSTLVTNPRGNVTSVAKTAAESISDVTSEAAGLVAQFQVKAS